MFFLLSPDDCDFYDVVLTQSCPVNYQFAMVFIYGPFRSMIYSGYEEWWLP